MSRFELSPEAEADLDGIWLYIANDSIEDANRVRDTILDALDGLADWPRKVHLRKDLTEQPIRFWTVLRWHILYDPDSVPLRILRILSAHRDIPRVLDEG